MTIRKQALLSLNRASYVLLGRSGAVELLFDRAAQVIGLVPTRFSAPNAHHVRHIGSPIGGPWVVSVMAFTKFYEIDTSISRRWPAFLRQGVLCADLSQPWTPVTSNRAGH